MPETSPPLPYEHLPSVPTFTLVSNDLVDGGTLPAAHTFAGDNVSPHLRWEGFPEGTGSFAVTCFDPDAPTGSGFWHWVVFDIPAGVTELATGAASGAMAELPAGAVHVRNDMGNRRFDGAAPPAGHGPHRYVFTVHALTPEKLGPDADASPAFVGFNMTFNVVARAALIASFEVTG